MRLLINNLLEYASFDVNGANTGFPVKNLYSQSLTEVVQFDEWIVIDLGVAVSINSIAMSNSSQSAIVVQANSSDSWASPPYVTGLTNANNIKFIDEEYRYWRIKSATPGTRMGYFYLGNFLQLPNPDTGSIPVPKNTDIINESSTRDIHSSPGKLYKTQGFLFGYVTDELFDAFESWYYSDDRANNHFLVQYEFKMTKFPPYFARISGYKPSRDHVNEKFRINATEAK